MKLSHTIILIALLTGQSVFLAFASTSVNGICQFDRSTMIKEKLKKAQECINNGNYSGAKNYLNGVLKLDSNNAKAKELLAVCNNRGKPVTSPRSNSSSLNSNNSNRNNSYSSALSVSENGDYVVISDKHLDASNTTDMSNLKKASEKYGHVKYACVTNRGLIVVCEKGLFYSNIPTNLEVALKSIKFRPDKVVFTDSGTYLITNENEAFSYHM